MSSYNYVPIVVNDEWGLVSIVPNNKDNTNDKDNITASITLVDDVKVESKPDVKLSKTPTKIVKNKTLSNYSGYL